jgi:hypothetical protein
MDAKKFHIGALLHLRVFYSLTRKDQAQMRVVPYCVLLHLRVFYHLTRKGWAQMRSSFLLCAAASVCVLLTH